MTNLLTEAEAAERLRMAPRTLRSLRAKGKITFVQLSPRNIAYRPEDCEEYVAACLKRNETPVDPRPKGSPRHRAAPVRKNGIVPFSQRNAR